MESRIALVTGASSGIGEATAHGLSTAGYKVYGTSRRGAVDLRGELFRQQRKPWSTSKLDAIPADRLRCPVTSSLVPTLWSSAYKIPPTHFNDFQRQRCVLKFPVTRGVQRGVRGVCENVAGAVVATPLYTSRSASSSDRDCASHNRPGDSGSVGRGIRPTGRDARGVAIRRNRRRACGRDPGRSRPGRS